MPSHALGKGKIMAQFTNQAQLSYNNSTVSSNIVTGQLQEVLTATKTAVNASYRIGDTVTYAVNLINSGATALSALTVSDDLGAYTVSGNTYLPLTYADGTVRYFINGVLQAAPTVSTAGGALVIGGITVPAGGNVTLLYDAQVNAYADPSATGTLTNTVTITGNVTSLTASETILANADALLSITKSLSPVPVTENGTLTYTFLIENTGSTAVEATGNLTVTDTFLPILSGITVTLNGTALSETTDYTYDETTGEFATVPGGITIPAATYSQGTDGTWVITPGSATLTVSGTVS